MKKKLKLNQLKVESFITGLEKGNETLDIQGGLRYTRQVTPLITTETTTPPGTTQTTAPITTTITDQLTDQTCIG